MNKDRHFKIIAFIIGALIAITAILSLYFVLYPLLTNNHAPDFILNILIVMNISIPTVGIASMIAFIYHKNKEAK